MEITEILSASNNLDLAFFAWCTDRPQKKTEHNKTQQYSCLGWCEYSQRRSEGTLFPRSNLQYPLSISPRCAHRRHTSLHCTTTAVFIRGECPFFNNHARLYCVLEEAALQHALFLICGFLPKEFSFIGEKRDPPCVPLGPWAFKEQSTRSGCLLVLSSGGSAALPIECGSDVCR